MKNKLSNIDWSNHIVAFFSALLGILIAFQLQDYQDDQKEEEELQITLEAIKNEIENNQNIYRTNIKTLTNFLEFYETIDFVVTEFEFDDGEVAVSKDKFEKMKLESPDRFDDWKLKRQQNDSTLIFESFDINIPGYEVIISTSSWQAGLYSGVLNRLDHSRLSKLTHIYKWIEKDIGLNEGEFWEDQFSDKLFGDLNLIVTYYKRLNKIQQMKLSIVSNYYDQIEWE